MRKFAMCHIAEYFSVQLIDLEWTFLYRNLALHLVKEICHILTDGVGLTVSRGRDT